MNEIIKILDLEEIELNHYRATSPNDGWQRVYGGQVIGQALVAASRTVPADRQVHSLHGYFLRAGDTEIPILYKVDRIRDGKSFTTRRVVAVQRGHAIFTLSISFQIEESGLSHQFPMPEAPRPESLLDERDFDLNRRRIGHRNIRRMRRRQSPLICDLWHHKTCSIPSQPNPGSSAGCAAPMPCPTTHAFTNAS